MLTLADVHTFRYSYCGNGEASSYPAWTIPLVATRFDGLPPTLAFGVEHDPLRDDARVFVERINAAGGNARLRIGTGLVHGCWRALASSPGVQAMHKDVCDFLSAQARG
jgi:acetyl esterase/lipase